MRNERVVESADFEQKTQTEEVKCDDEKSCKLRHTLYRAKRNRCSPTR